MGHIIRNRLFPGTSVVDGNNPPKIQGNTVSRKVSGRKTIVRDYLDLTDSILDLPREVEHYRYESPLMGGITTVKNHSGPVNDYLALQYLKDAPPQGYMGPANRVAETPDITIGKAGTIDVKLKCHIRTLVKAKALVDTKNLIDSVWYNLTDFDDPTAPAFPIKLAAADWDAKLLPPTKTLGGLTGPGRIVGLVSLTPAGVTAVDAARAEYTKAGGHPCELFSKFGWFELQIIEDGLADFTVNLQDITVLGATHSHDKKSFEMNLAPVLPEYAAVPVERCNISVAANKTTHTANPVVPIEYAPVPVWDIKNIEYAAAGGGKYTVTVTVNIDDAEVKIPITTIHDPAVVKYDVRNQGVLRPIFQLEKDKGLEHPFFPNSVFSYLRADAQGETSPFHFVPQQKIKTLDPYVRGWKPNTYAKTVFTMAGVDKTVSVPSGYVMESIVPPAAIPAQYKTLDDVDLEFKKLEAIAGTAAFDNVVSPVRNLNFNTGTGKLTGQIEAATAEGERTISIKLKAGAAVVAEYPLKLNIVKAAYIVSPAHIKTEYKIGETVDLTFLKAGPSHGTAVFEAVDTHIDGVTFTVGTGKLFGTVAEGVVPQVYDIPLKLKLRAADVDTYPLKLTILPKDAVSAEPAAAPKAAKSSKSAPRSYTRIEARLIRTPCTGPDDIEVLGWMSDGSDRVLSPNEYTIHSPDHGMITITLNTNPSISTQIKTN